MAETTRGRVTITLGRSGEVVNRAGPASDAGYSYSPPRVGSRRPIKDRLGGDIDSYLLHGGERNNKRRREDVSLRAHDIPISKHDLRYKLMQKDANKRAKTDDQRAVDLRLKLSKYEQPPFRGVKARSHMVEPRATSILGSLPPVKPPLTYPQMSPSSTSYSPWTLDHIRRRSQDEFLGTSRGLLPPQSVGRFTDTSRGFSPPRTVGELHGRPLRRALDDVTVAPYMSKDVFDVPRTVNTAPFTTGSTLPPPAPKPPPSLSAPCRSLPSQLPPPGSVALRNPFTGEEQQTVDGLLNSLGLGKYAILFKAEEVDMPALKQMGENDLKDLGIPMGPRKKIFQALLPSSKRQP